MFQWACGGDWSDGMGPEPHGVRVDPSPAQLPSPLRHRYRHRSCQRRRGPPRSRWRPLAINNRKRRSHAFTGLTPSTRYYTLTNKRDVFQRDQVYTIYNWTKLFPHVIIDRRVDPFSRRWRGWCGRCKTLRAGYPCAAKNNFSPRSLQRSWVSAIGTCVVE